MATKKPTAAELAAFEAWKLSQVPQPQVANLATSIPDSAWESLRTTVVTVTDNEGRDRTFRDHIVAFGEQVPQAQRGLPIPQAIAEAQATLVANAYLATKGDVSKLSEAEQKRVKASVTQKRSRALSLFLCAAIVPEAIKQGFTGGIVETGKLCTALKDAKFDLAKVMEARKAAADAPKDYGAYIAQVMAGVLNAQGEIGALSAKAKAQLVMWCDEYNIKPKHADTYRNIPLAKG